MKDCRKPCCTALFPGEVYGDVQEDYEQKQESAHAPGKANLREFAAQEGDLGVGGNVAQQQYAQAVVDHPCYKDDSQVDGADVHDDGADKAGELQGCTVVHQGESFAFRLAVFADDIGLAATENESENEGLDGAEHHQQETTAPEVEFIHGTCGKAENAYQATQEGHGARGGDSLFTLEFQVIFAETDERLDDRNGAGDTGNKEHGEPECLEESAERQLAEYERHGLETEAEGTELGTFFDVIACDKHGHRNHDGAAQDNFGKAVGCTGGQGRKDQVFLGFQVACIAENDSHAEAHGEEHLARCRKPYGGVENFRKVRVPYESKTLADVANGEYAHHKNNAHNQENRHGHLVHAFDALAHAERQKAHVAGERNQEEQDGGRNGAHLGVQHDVVAEEFLHRFVTAGDHFHELARGGIVSERQNPGLYEHVVETDEQRGEQPQRTQVLCPRLFTEDIVESTWGGTVVLVACGASECPFHPGKGDAEEQEGDEVGDDKGSATVRGCLYRKT